MCRRPPLRCSSHIDNHRILLGPSLFSSISPISSQVVASLPSHTNTRGRGKSIHHQMRGKCRRPAPPGGDGDATAVLEDADLEEILLRLPSPADLARAAALVCRRWRRVASGPAFLRRFRRLHPPQLLGFFICKGGRPYRDHVLDRLEGRVPDQSPPGARPYLPPGGPRRIPPSPAAGTSPSAGCLPHRDIPKHFAICDPLSGHSVVLPARDNSQYFGSKFLGAALVISDKDEGDVFSFEVLIATCYKKPRLGAFSSSKREWAVVPCPDAKKKIKPWIGDDPWIGDGAHASGCVYWVVHDWEWEFEYILVLNSQTKRFSTINLPCKGMCDKYDRDIKVVRSEGDSDIRVVAMDWSSIALRFWRRDRSRSTKGRWLKEDVVNLIGVGGVVDILLRGWGELRIIDAGEGFVFFKHFENPWVFVLNLMEMTLHKLPNRRQYSGHALPYRMALSPALPKFEHEGNH
ncbi:hypothetical protein HU200_041603 [Digitaria exilis]|uniref:F-box domain-containing protein n=1 Tax=Digitaria exilis TaxID=1010633 RepID=A0A835B7M2_9POAL|nr:hypothetical protein HU200_041603 [Digitaria exilis]